MSRAPRPAGAAPPATRASHSAGAGLGRDEELEAERLAGVAGAPDAHARPRPAAQHRRARCAAAPAACPRSISAGEDVARRRPLQGDHGDLAGRVAQLEVGEARRLRREVLPVLEAVGGVDDEQVLVVDEAVQVGVVERAAAPRRR